MNGAVPAVVVPVRLPRPSTNLPSASKRMTPKIKVPETLPPTRLPLTFTAALSIETIGNFPSASNCGSMTTLVMLPFTVRPKPPMFPTAAES